MIRCSTVVGAVLVLSSALTASLDAQVGAARLYVPNQDDATITVIALPDHKVVTTLALTALGFGSTAKPHHVQVDPDGRHWYVTLIGAGKLLKFNEQNQIVGSVDLEVPGLIAIDPTSDKLLVGRSMSAVNPPSRLAVIDRREMKLLAEYDVFFPRPHALVVHPNGKYAYAASLGVNQFASLRMEDGEQTLVDIEGAPRTLTQFSISPDGNWLLVTAESSNQLLVFSLADSQTPRLVNQIPMAAGPFESIFTFDGRWVFVTNLRANQVSMIDPEGWRVVAEITDPSLVQPHGLALSPDGRYVYVSSRHQSGGAHDHEGNKAIMSGTVTVVCIATKTVVAVVPAGNYAAGLGATRPTQLPDRPGPCS